MKEETIDMQCLVCSRELKEKYAYHAEYGGLEESYHECPNKCSGVEYSHGSTFCHFFVDVDHTEKIDWIGGGKMPIRYLCTNGKPSRMISKEEMDGYLTKAKENYSEYCRWAGL